MIPKNTELSLDSKVILLLCSDLIKSDKTKSFTQEEWGILSKRIAHSPIKSPKGFYEINSSEWGNMLSLNTEIIERINTLLSYGGQLSFELERLANRGIWVITRADALYPSILKTNLKHKSPVILYGSGSMEVLNGTKLAIVGSRDIEIEEMNYIKQLVKKGVFENFTIVSGGSKGTDSVAELTALQNGGKVVSILSEDLEKHILKKEIRNEILKRKLLVLSPYNPRITFKAYNALGRNKYIYGLSDYSVVISALENAGGTWKGAIENYKLNITPMFVKESSVKSGNKKLVQMGVEVLSTELIENEEFKLSKWFLEKSKEKKPTDKIEQLEFENIVDSKPQTPTENRVVNSVEVSIFDTVWPIIEKKLSIERTVEWLCNELNIRKVQLNDWLKQAEQLGKVKKLNKPIRYISTDANLNI